MNVGTTDYFTFFKARNSAGAGVPALAYTDFTAYYCKGSGTATQITLVSSTGPGDAHSDGKIPEVSASNMPGWYKLHAPDLMFSTEDEVSLHISASGILDVEIVYRVERPKVDIEQVSGDATAADNLELMYDGTGYTDPTAPAARAQVDNIGAASGGAVSFAASDDNATGTNPLNGITFVGSAVTGSRGNMDAENGLLLSMDDTGNDIDFVVEYDVGVDRIATQTSIVANVDGNAASMHIEAYDWVGADWDVVAVLDGSDGTAFKSLQIDLLQRHTGTGANAGKVFIRFDNNATSPSKLEVDKCLVAAVINTQALGFIEGAVWIDTNNGTSGTAEGVGTVQLPSNNIEDAKTIADANNLKIFNWLPGSSDTLTEALSGYWLRGFDYTVGLGGQSITNTRFTDATISGTGSGTGVLFERCHVNAGTSTGPGTYDRCIWKGTSGSPWTANGAGEYLVIDPDSGVAGAGTPHFVFSGTLAPTGVNIRGSNGGSHITLDSDNTLTLEVSEGGGQTIVTGGADCEIRGLMRSLTVTMSAAETVQFVGTTGPVTLSGTTTGTVNLYGMISSLSDTTSAATVNHEPSMNNLAEVVGNAVAATNLRESSLALVTGTVVDDVGNTATTFKIDSTLGAKGDDYFGGTAGGLVLVFVNGTTNEWQSRRVTDFVTSTDFITVEEAFNAEPADTDGFVLLGRIEA